MSTCWHLHTPGMLQWLSFVQFFTAVQFPVQDLSQLSNHISSLLKNSNATNLKQMQNHCQKDIPHNVHLTHSFQSVSRTDTQRVNIYVCIHHPWTDHIYLERSRYFISGAGTQALKTLSSLMQTHTHTTHIHTPCGLINKPYY